VIAIDGLSGTGKSTLARVLAARLGLACLNTGLYFRWAAWIAQREGRDPNRVAARIAAIEEPLVLYHEASALEASLRDPRLAALLGRLTQEPAVREAVLAQERADIAALGSVVVEGRDIGTVVVPTAQLKLFLVARDAVRLARRHEEGAAVLQRDRDNARRLVAPALPAPDALVVDTSDVAVEELADRVLVLFDMVEQVW